VITTRRERERERERERDRERLGVRERDSAGGNRYVYVMQTLEDCFLSKILNILTRKKIPLQTFAIYE
jgi:hypothetical protein